MFQNVHSREHTMMVSITNTMGLFKNAIPHTPKDRCR